MSSTYSCTASKVTWPGQPTAMPSAMVRMCSSGTGCPSASDFGYAAAPAAWTPTTRTSGLRALTAMAMPASSPPPPVGTTTVLTSGTCSMISRPQVPWPVTMSTWSKGWISTAPVSCGEGPGGDQRLVEVLAVEDDVGAVRLGRADLGDRRALGHEDGGLDAEQAGRQGHALGVVAGGRGDHAVGALGLGQPGDPQVGAAGLERAGALEVLELEVHVAAGGGRQPARASPSGVTDGHAVQHLASGLDVGQRHGRRSRGPPSSGEAAGSVPRRFPYDGSRSSGSGGGSSPGSSAGGCSPSAA